MYSDFLQNAIASFRKKPDYVRPQFFEKSDVAGKLNVRTLSVIMVVVFQKGKKKKKVLSMNDERRLVGRNTCSFKS